MSDIVERLRGLQAEVEADRPFRYVKDIFKEAADEIERLQAENNVLHKTDKWRYENVLRMKAEIERLRAALREVITTDPATDPPEASSDWYQEWKGLAFRLKGIARRALEGEPTDAQLARYHGDVDGDAAL